MTTKELDSQFDKLLGGLDSVIRTLPDETPEEIAERENAIAEQNARAVISRRIAASLGDSTGWPSKYRGAVETPPQGAEWLAAFAVAQEAMGKNAIIVFYGSRGSGKTRMAAELAMIRGGSRYRTAMRFFLEIRATFKSDSKKSEMDILDELTKSDLLILDEIQERGETSFENRLLTHVIDVRYSNNRPTIMIANLPKKELAESLGASIIDRARENGKSIEFNWPSYRSQS